MADKKILEREQLTDEQLDRVAGGTGDCGEPPDTDEIHQEQEPDVTTVTPPYIPPPNRAGETDIADPSTFYK